MSRATCLTSCPKPDAASNFNLTFTMARPPKLTIEPPDDAPPKRRKARPSRAIETKHRRPRRRGQAKKPSPGSPDTVVRPEPDPTDEPRRLQGRNYRASPPLPRNVGHEGARPDIEFTATDYEIIEIAAGYGLSKTQIARLLGLTPTTFQNRIDADPEIRVCLELGLPLAEYNVGHATYRLAIGDIAYILHTPDGPIPVYSRIPDIKAIRWWEMTRAKRSSLHRVEVEDLTPPRPVDAVMEEINAILTRARLRAEQAEQQALPPASGEIVVTPAPETPC